MVTGVVRVLPVQRYPWVAHLFANLSAGGLENTRWSSSHRRETFLPRRSGSCACADGSCTTT